MGENNSWISTEEYLPLKLKEGNFGEYIVTVLQHYIGSPIFSDEIEERKYVTVALYDAEQKIWHLHGGDVQINALIKKEDAPINAECITDWMKLPEARQNKI